MPRDYRRSNSRSSGRHSRSRSISRNRYRRDRNERRERSSDGDYSDSSRLHIADLTKDITQSDLERAFSKYGELKEVWLAKNPPCFAFVVFKDKNDASVALKEMDERTIGSCRIRVTVAKPRTKGSGRKFDPSMRCYQCGDRGHFSRDCRNGAGGYRRRRSYSRDRSSRDRSDYRRRSRSRNYSRRSRSKSPRRYRNGY